MENRPVGESLEELKASVKAVAGRYVDRLDRSRRLYIEDRPRALADSRDQEYKIKSQIAKYFGIRYSSISFCGSAQIGFSVYKDTLFAPARSDLDVACISGDLFQRAWTDVVETSRAFNDFTPFGNIKLEDVVKFREQISARGMIRIRQMPKSPQSILWRTFEDRISREFRSLFGSVSIAVYMNEYAFCWKQDSALVEIMGK